MTSGSGRSGPGSCRAFLRSIRCRPHPLLLVFAQIHHVQVARAFRVGKSGRARKRAVRRSPHRTPYKVGAVVCVHAKA